MQLSYVCPEKAVFPGQTGDIVHLVRGITVFVDERVNFFLYRDITLRREPKEANQGNSIY